jgi:hypothetical protein
VGSFGTSTYATAAMTAAQLAVEHRIEIRAVCSGVQLCVQGRVLAGLRWVSVWGCALGCGNCNWGLRVPSLSSR